MSDWAEAVERAQAWLSLGRAVEPKEPEPPAKEPAKEETNMAPKTLDEWQRALDAPWTQKDLAWVRDHVDPSLVHKAGIGPDGQELLATAHSKRDIWTMVDRYPTNFKPPAPPPKEDEGEEAILRARYPTMFGGKR